MHRVAQTNIQLYNQLYGQGRTDDELRLVRAAYDASALLTSGYYQADGKPFICHSVGVASILALMGAPAPFLAFGLLHNIYVNGDFGNGLRAPLTADMREFLRQRVGAEVEDLVIRFRALRVSADSIDRIEAGLSRLDATERMLVAAALADHLEKYVDRGVLYFGDGSWITGQTDAQGHRLIALAERLGQHQLAQMLRDAFAAVEDQAPMPEFMRPPQDRKYVALTLPLSTRLRWLPRVRRKLMRGWQQLCSPLRRLAGRPATAARPAIPLPDSPATER